MKALRSQAVKETFNGFDNEQLEKIKTCLEMSEWHLHELENYTDKRIRLRNKLRNMRKYVHIVSTNNVRTTS